MKHNFRVTSELLLWTAMSLFFGLIVAPKVLSTKTQQLPISPFAFVMIVFGLLLLSAYVWLKLFKRLKPDTLVGVFSGGIGAIMYRALTALLPLPEFGSAIETILVMLGIVYIFGFLFYYLVKSMQRSWKATKRYYFIANIIMIIVLPVVATIMAKGVPLWASLLLLFLAACYDAYAVWKSKHMIVLAKTFVKLRILPGIIVPRKKKDNFAILGGGDIFFISFVGASAFSISAVTAMTVVMSGFASVLFLFAISRRGKFYPALPFILIGIILGIAGLRVFG